jgi:hypothetical protein
MAIYRGVGGAGDATTDASSASTLATTKAAEAAASAAAALISEDSAEASATAAAGYVDTFDDKYLGSKATAPTVDNDGDPLTDGALYFLTTTNIMYVYDLATTTWLQLTLTSADQTNVDAAVANAANINAVAGNATNINAVNANATNINATASIASPINTVSSNIANVNTVATNVADVVTFATTYLGSFSNAAIPTTTQVGALYWNTTVDQLYIWDGATWNNAAFDVTGAVTSFNTRTGGVTLSSSDVTTALGFTPETSLGYTPVTDARTLTVNGTAYDLTENRTWTITANGLLPSQTGNGGKVLTTDGANLAWLADATGVASFNTRTGAVTLSSADVTDALTYTPVNPSTISAFGATLIDDADAPTARTTLGLVIGTDVQAYNATYVVDADIGVTVQAYDATIVVDADIGSTVQAYDADTAKTDVDQTFTGAQRGTVTNNTTSLSFDQDTSNNFTSTPSAGTLTFTNHTAGQSGYILLDNTAAVAITAAATTKINATDLATINVAGVYLVSYFDNGTNAYLTVSAAYA